jgi:hypothetical protein
MGWFSDDSKAKKAASATGRAVAKSLAWPVKKVSGRAYEKYLKQKGKWNSDVCPECGNPISKQGGYIHTKCWREFKSTVDKLSTPHHKDGSSRSGNWFSDCNCNRNWAVHECKGKMGDPI